MTNGASVTENKRKFQVFWGVFGCSVALLLLGYVNGDQFVDITIAVVGLYMAGNVGEHWARRRQYERESEAKLPEGWGEA